MKGLGYTSVVQSLPSMLEALGLIPASKKKKTKKIPYKKVYTRIILNSGSSLVFFIFNAEFIICFMTKCDVGMELHFFS
jgi:hypothetical protein